MRIWSWFILTFILGGVIGFFAMSISFWFFLLVVLLLIFVLGYGVVTYNYRKSLIAEPVPAKGYDTRIRLLELNTKEVSNLGFEKYHEFYLKMIPDVVVYVLKHKEEPIYLDLYHFGSKETMDLYTWYENDYGLTTSNIKDGGAMPTPAKRLFQIFLGVSHEKLLEMHKKAHKFLLDKGLKPSSVPKEEFQNHFLKVIRGDAEYIRKFSFWPIRMFFWVITKRRCASHRQDIETQYKNGFVKL